jgi:hypothetical protein
MATKSTDASTAQIEDKWRELDNGHIARSSGDSKGLHCTDRRQMEKAGQIAKSAGDSKGLSHNKNSFVSAKRKHREEFFV